MFTQIGNKKVNIFITTQTFMIVEIIFEDCQHFLSFFFKLTSVIVYFLQRLESILNPIIFSLDEQACTVRIVTLGGY